MWLATLLSMCCGTADEDWIPRQFANVNDREGPLAEECCDTTCDTSAIQQMAYVGWSNPHQKMGMPEHSLRRLQHQDCSALVEPVCPSAPEAIMFGDVEVATWSPAELSSSPVETLIEGSAEEVNSPSHVQTPVKDPEEHIVVGRPVGGEPCTGFERRSAVQQVDRHRRVLGKGQMVAAITAEIKSKLGAPVRNRDNDLTIRYLAGQRCTDLGVRPHHQRSVIERTLAMVYAPDDADVEGVELFNSRAMHDAHARLAYAGKSNLYRTFVSRRTHALFFSGPPSGSAHA